jgi:hypothetical protein
MTREAAEPLEAVTTPSPAVTVSPGSLAAGVVATPTLARQLARSSPEQRKKVVEGLSATAGNRRVTGMLLRTPAEEPTPYPHPLRTERVEAPDGRSFRISQWGSDPTEKLKPGQKASEVEVFWVEFEVDPQGTMRSSARTVDPSGRYRSPTLRLKEQFNKAIEFFKGKPGGGPAHFEGDWSYMSPTEPSANLKAYNKAIKEGKSPADAARATPSGRVAAGAGMTEVQVLSDKPEKVEEIGDGKDYQRVRARFSRPTPGRPPQGTGGATPPARTGGSTSNTKASTKAAAGAALVVMGTSIALNWLIESGNEKRIREELARKEPQIRKEQEQDKTLGFLLLFRYRAGASGLEGSSASPRFEVLSWRRGYTRAEAEDEFRRQPIADVDHRYEFGWIEPLVAPSPLVVATPWRKVAVARFTDISKIAFQKAAFKEWGGFDTNGRNGPVDARRWDADARAFRFIVLQPPKEITIHNVAGRRAQKEIDSRQIAVAGGTVPALDLDGTAAVTVWPADAPTERLFEHTDKISDKEGKLRLVPNIDRVRWLLPDQVTLVSTL